MAAPNSNARKIDFKLQYPSKSKTKVKNYLVRLYLNTDHVQRWMTPVLLQNFDVLHITRRQMEHVIMWVRKKFNVELEFSVLEIDPSVQGPAQ